MRELSLSLQDRCPAHVLALKKSRLSPFLILDDENGCISDRFRVG